ncbi:MAG: helix-turn-helix domain-containing protein [Oscillospiraceae bacterium]|nr:helix-turn-helix domain-containing protein [Oscillospiraceae bacterium]
MTIGKKLQNLRLKSKKTLKEISEIFNITINTVYRWEHELTIPRKPILEKMAKYYQVPFEWLLPNGSHDESNECDGCTLNFESNTKQQLLNMYKRLSDYNKYKVLGYIERLCVEEMDENKNKSAE